MVSDKENPVKYRTGFYVTSHCIDLTKVWGNRGRKCVAYLQAPACCRYLSHHMWEQVAATRILGQTMIE